MDPNAAYRTMLDADEAWPERGEASQALLRWLISGGFAPRGVGPERARDLCASVTTLARANGWTPEPEVRKVDKRKRNGRARTKR